MTARVISTYGVDTSAVVTSTSKPANSRPETNWLDTSPDTGDAAAAHTIGMDDDRQAAGLAELFDPHADRSQGVERRRHRAAAHRRRGIDLEPSVAPHAATGAMKRAVVPDRRTSSRASVAGIDAALAVHRDAITGDVDVDAERAQAVDHGLGVVGPQRTLEHAGAVGQRGTDQRPVGDALRARHGDRRVRRSSERLDGQHVGHSSVRTAGR